MNFFKDDNSCKTPYESQSLCSEKEKEADLLNFHDD